MDSQTSGTVNDLAEPVAMAEICGRKFKALACYLTPNGAGINFSANHMRPPDARENHNFTLHDLNPLTPRRTQVSPFTEISILF